MIPKEPMHELFIGPQHYTAGGSFPDPRHIKIYDTTLRDGEQMPGVAMSPESKYLIAKELSAIGCHIIDLGFPSSAPSELATLQMVLQGKAKGEIREDMEVLVMCRANPRDVDTTIETLRKKGFSANDVTFLIFTASSPLHCKYKLGQTLLKREGLREDEDAPLSFFHEANKKMVFEVIRYARSKGIERIEFGAEDSSRTPLPQLVDLVQTALDAGAFRYIFADTTGSLTPEATKVYCQAIKKHFPDIPLGNHFHNDFDLATINVVTAIANGMPIFSTTVNGIGERAGNAPLHSVVACLKYLYGIEIPNFQYDRLWRLKRLVENITGIPVQAQEPVIGFNVYSHESGIHTHGVSIARCMYEPIPYQEVGGTARMVYGKHSGAHGIKYILDMHADEIGAGIDEEFVSMLLHEIKALRESNTRKTDTEKYISLYYENLYDLGIDEEELVHMAKQLAAAQRIAFTHKLSA